MRHFGMTTAEGEVVGRNQLALTILGRMASSVMTCPTMSAEDQEMANSPGAGSPSMLAL